MTDHRLPSDLIATWAADMKADLVTDLTQAQVWAVAQAAAQIGIAGGVGTAALTILEGGTPMTASTIGAFAAAGLKAKVVAGSLAAALTAGGAAAATGNLPDGAQSFVAETATHVGLNLPRPETEVDLFARADAVADEFITVSTVGQVGVALDADGLNLTDIMGNAGVTADVVVETADSIIVEFMSEAEVATVVVTRAGDEIVADISRTELGADVDAEVGVDIGSTGVELTGTREGSTGVETSESASTEQGRSGSNESSTEAGVGASADATVEQCVTADAAGSLGLTFSGVGTEGTTDVTGSGSTDACVSAEAEGEGKATIGVGG